jgi:hypothetical protein
MKNVKHMSSAVPIAFDPIDPPSERIGTNEVKVVGEKMPCKKCGKSHGMGILDTQTGIHTPIDICKDCMIIGTYIALKQPIDFSEVGDVCDALQEMFTGGIGFLEKGSDVSSHTPD